jgi:hypothetical protein
LPATGQEESIEWGEPSTEAKTSPCGDGAGPGLPDPRSHQHKPGLGRTTLAPTHRSCRGRGCCRGRGAPAAAQSSRRPPTAPHPPGPGPPLRSSGKAAGWLAAALRGRRRPSAE